MKKFILFILTILTISQVNGYSQRSRDRHNVVRETSVKSDSTEYELVVFDPEFEIWLAMQPAKNFYSQKYYETKNALYVSEWNQRYMSSAGNRGLYLTYIDYQPSVNYGLDLNYRLYYFFRYFEVTNRIRLLPSSR